MWYFVASHRVLAATAITYTMVRLHRIATEILAPPALGAIVMTAYVCVRSAAFEELKWLPVYLVCAYPVAILPSFIYAVAMEYWFRHGLQLRFGLLGTTLVSAALGGVCGAVINVLFHSPVPFAFGGVVVGTILGFCLGLSYDPDA